jgi:hypothetical protein
MANEDPLYASSIETGSLVMRQASCFYCGINHYDDYIIDYMFGIRACKWHQSNAERDNRAYCHRMKIVSLHTERKNPLFARLIQELMKDVKVKRSSGLIEDGWSLRSIDLYGGYTFIRKIDEDWCIGLVNRDSKSKNVSFKDLIQVNEFNTDFLSYLDEFEKKLEEGLYIQEYNIVESLRNTRELPELDNVYTTVLADGRPVRVYAN